MVLINGDAYWVSRRLDNIASSHAGALWGVNPSKKCTCSFAANDARQDDVERARLEHLNAVVHLQMSPGSLFTGGPSECFDKSPSSCRLPPTDRYNKQGTKSQQARRVRRDTQHANSRCRTAGFPSNEFTTKTSKWYND